MAVEAKRSVLIMCARSSCEAEGGAVSSGKTVAGSFLILFFSLREKLEEKAKLYEKMTKGDFIGKYNELYFIFVIDPAF